MTVLVWSGLLTDLAPEDSRWRRLLTTLAVFHDSLPTWRQRMQRVRAVWPEHQLNRPGLVTIGSALLELEDLGLVEVLDQTAEGFLVKLKEAA